MLGKDRRNMAENFKQAKEAFISQWGALGSNWGISRTMAQVHALLMVSPEPLCTDQCMEELAISRGNAHTNLKELVGWGLVRLVVKKGQRKEYFEAEKDVWKIFTIVLRERKRREVDPAITLLADCRQGSANGQSDEARAFHAQMQGLHEFAVFASKVGEKISQLKYGTALKNADKFLGLLPKQKID